MIEVTDYKESKNFTLEIKRLDTIIAKNKSKIKSLKIAKQKLEKTKNKNFVEIAQLKKAVKIAEVFAVDQQNEKNNQKLAKLKKTFWNESMKTYMIEEWKNEIKITNENLITNIEKQTKLDNEIKIMKEEEKNLQQEYQAKQKVNNNDLNKKLTVLNLRLKSAKLLVQLARKDYKMGKLFVSIAADKLKIANKCLLIKQKNWQLYLDKRTEKEFLDAWLSLEFRYKISNIFALQLVISKKKLAQAKINEEIATVNCKINKKAIKIKKCFVRIRQIYNSQSIIKVRIKTWLNSPFIWLSKIIKKYKYKITLNKYQMQLAKLDKEIKKLTLSSSESFYHKILTIISCGLINTQQNSKIREQKTAKLNEIKQKIYQLKNQKNIKSQPIISTWDSDEIAKISENIYQTAHNNGNNYFF